MNKLSKRAIDKIKLFLNDKFYDSITLSRREITILFNFYKNASLEIFILEGENKQLKSQLIQSEEVIKECKESIQNFMTHIDDGFCADMMTFIDILTKHKRGNK